MAVLLLDLDNTLADRESAFRRWAHRKASEWAPNDAGAVAFLIAQDEDGVRSRRAFFSAARDRFALGDAVEALVADYRRALRELLPPIPQEVVERLRALRNDGWKLAVVTNGEADVQAAKIEHLDLAPLLDACCISGELGLRKPDPRIFQVALNRCGATAAEAWMVGDGEADVEGGHRARVRTIWLHRGRTWTRTDLKPDTTAANVLEAVTLVQAAAALGS
jgi:putative hydrolase of the HAD superfamily